MLQFNRPVYRYQWPMTAREIERRNLHRLHEGLQWGEFENIRAKAIRKLLEATLRAMDEAQARYGSDTQLAWSIEADERDPTKLRTRVWPLSKVFRADH